MKGDPRVEFGDPSIRSAMGHLKQAQVTDNGALNMSFFWMLGSSADSRKRDVLSKGRSDYELPLESQGTGVSACIRNAIWVPWPKCSVIVRFAFG